mgnify:FL=1
MKPMDRPLTPEIKRQIDEWFNDNYNELVRQTGVYLRKYGHHDIDPFEYLSKLYDVLLRKAYGEKWATDEDILLQSKRRLLGYVQDLHTQRKHDSTEDIQDAHDSAGAELPSGFVVEPDHDRKLHLEEVAQARDAVCQTPYDYDLVLVLQGDETCVAVGQKYGVHHSTVSRHKDQIAQKLREQMLNRGLV